jgi:undecaprenyl-diphosphatase
MVLRHIFGVAQKEPIRDLLVHMAVLGAVLLACRGMFSKIRREQILAHRMRRNPSQVHALKGVYNMRLVRTAAPIMLVGLFASLFFLNFYEKRMLFSLMLIINGAMILFPIYIHHGNRDARSMSKLDGFLVGIAAALSAIPGLSRNGAIMFVTLVRGADKQNGVIWALMLTVPAMILLCFLDLIAIFMVGTGSVSMTVFVGYLLSALFAFIGAFLAVTIIRTLIARSDYSIFAYYDFGLALFAFVLYLIA